MSHHRLSTPRHHRPSSPVFTLLYTLAACLLAILTMTTTGCFLLPLNVDTAGQASDSSEEDYAGEDWNVFPESEVVDEIIERPLPEDDDIFVNVGAEAEIWEIEEPAPSTAGALPYEGDNWGGAALAGHARRSGDPNRVTAAMTCLAREQGRFWRTFQEPPAPHLHDYLIARCGTTVNRAATNFLHGEISPPRGRHSEQDVRIMLSTLLAREYRKLRGESGPGSVFGAWYDGDKDGGNLYIVYGTRKFRLEPFSMDVSGRDHVLLTGVQPGDTTTIEAISSTGATVAHCTKVRPVIQKPGYFTLRCPVHATDSEAYIDILEMKRNRMLGNRVLTLFVSPDGTMPRVYAEPQSPISKTIAPADPAVPADPDHLLDIINDLRGSNRLPPLKLDPGQSTEMSQLLPHYIAAAHNPAQAELADTIALAFLAGRKAESLIRDADFLHFTSVMDGDRDIAKMLARQCRSPMVRSTLMDPEADSLAIGMHQNKAGNAAVFVVSTYDHPDSTHYTEWEAALFDNLNETRGRHSRSRARRLTNTWTVTAMDQAMAKMGHGVGPNYSARQALEVLIRNHRQGFGYTYFPLGEGQLDDVVWPQEMLELDQLRVSIRAGYYHPPGGTWAYELALVVYTGA